MFDALFEGRLAVYIVLAALAAALLYFAWQRRNRRLLIAGAVALLLPGVYFLLDIAVETDREQITRNLEEMTAAVKARDVDGIFKHVAADFNYHGLNRDAFRQLVAAALNGRRVNEIRVWDIDVGPRDASSNERKVEFKAKALLPGTPPEFLVNVQAQFVREEDGQWRMKTFKVFEFGKNTEMPIELR